jgi:hypothetical protein
MQFETFTLLMNFLKRSWKDYVMEDEKRKRVETLNLVFLGTSRSSIRVYQPFVFYL